MWTYRDLCVNTAVCSLILVFLVLVVLISRHNLILIFSSRQFWIYKIKFVVTLISAATIDLSPLEPNRVWPHKAVFLLLKMMVQLFPAWKGAHGLLLLPNELAV